MITVSHLYHYFTMFSAWAFVFMRFVFVCTVRVTVFPTIHFDSVFIISLISFSFALCSIYLCVCVWESVFLVAI